MTTNINSAGRPEADTSSVTRTAEAAAAVDAGWQALEQTADASLLAAFQQRVRALVAAAESDGHAKVAELASILDLMLAPVIAGEERLTPEFADIVRDYVVAAVRASRQAPARPGSTPAREPVAHGTEVVLMEPEPRLADELQRQIGHFGYAVRTVASTDVLLSAVDLRRPHAVIIDSEPGDGGGITVEFARELRQRAGERVPLIFIGQHDDVESRLRAARAGADAYLVKPFDLHELVDQLDRIAIDGKQEPYLIVVVEDSPTQAAYYSAILRKADMIPIVVNDPLRVLDALNEHAADLVLMDMYMPGCNGMELAKVIRQVPRYASIPIVYLSAETELDRQLDAMSLGADDFLTKPINPSHLIRSVSIRAERARSLRMFMLTDNLTGLLNHTRIKEQLQHEVARAMRGGGQLAFAMLDIDHFKSVNDSHGHHVGDRVIKTLARTLQQRLRQTDHIGRYGGEEFAVILPDAGLKEAVAILEEIRVGFAKIEQVAPSGTFKASFSGGVAVFPASADAAQLAVDADQALYAAKRAGRNRIVGHVAGVR